MVSTIQRMHILHLARSNVVNTKRLRGHARDLARQHPLTCSQEQGTAMDNMLIRMRLKRLATAVDKTIVAEMAVGALEY